MKQALTLALGYLFISSLPVDAQYFGRNKVQYETFDFRVLQTPHFDVHYYPAEESAVTHAAHLIERQYARLSHTLDHQFTERQPIVLYASHAHFVQTTVVRGFLSEGVGGLTEHQRGRIVMPFTVSLGETERVLAHELAHAFQRDILRKRGRSMSVLPLWFLEGMAEYLALRRIDANTAMWLRDAAADDRLPTLEQLEDPRYFPYRYGQALWCYLAERFGEQIVARSLNSHASGGAIGRIKAVTGVDAETLSADWHAWIRNTAASAHTEPVPENAVISRSKGAGKLNVGPALSPDGTEIVFLSERDDYSIDVYLADATTGAIKRRLVQTAANPHFDNLQFIGSAGSWDPNGRRFALAATHEGQPILTIIDTTTGSVEREIALPTVDEAFNPAWSPDGRRLVFSALKGGFSDLYVLELDSGNVRPLTSDPFGDLQPAWAPDGNTIAFTTDRFSSSIDTLSFGDFQLGLLDVASGAIRALPAIPGAKQIDPQWSPDGSSLYFVADSGQVSDVYRLEMATGHLFRITHLDTGVSGISALSPALSVASGSGRIAFGVYRHGAYELHVRDSAEGTPLSPEEARHARVFRNPSQPPAVNMPSIGLGGANTFPIRKYRSGLSLDGIAQPYLSAGGGSFGTFVRAGVSLSFGDMLGQHSLRTALQAGKSVHDFAVHAAYVNRQSRWNWAISGGQAPAVIGVSRMQPQAAEATVIDSEFLYRQLHRRISGTAIYPFSSAKRFEVSTAMQTTSFDQEETTSVYSTRTGELLQANRGTSVTALPVALFETAAALVHDSALLGPTSPVLGTRYRFEVAPTFGDLAFTTALADYRRYVMPVQPFTLALRLKHLGRYGPDAADPRLLPLVFNLRDLVRGYDARRLAADVCGDDRTASCTGRQYLGTHHMLLANIEWRFPIMGVLQRTASYGPLPLEGVVFSDNGWFRSRTTDIRSRDWQMRRSIGAGVRLNAAGFVFELAAARRLERRQAGWTLAVNLRPGF